ADDAVQAVSVRAGGQAPGGRCGHRAGGTFRTNGTAGNGITVSGAGREPKMTVQDPSPTASAAASRSPPAASLAASSSRLAAIVSRFSVLTAVNGRSSAHSQ